MKPVNPIPATLECPCGWSRKVYPGENAEKAAAYHAIQVHNSQEAVRQTPIH